MSKKNFYVNGRVPWYDEEGKAKTPLVIGVAGGSASGKTSVCSSIVKRVGLQWVALICMDSYYRPLTAEERKEVHNFNFDHPTAIEMELLVQHIRDLKAGKPVQIPAYDFKTHFRKESEAKTIYGADCIILEGIYMLYDETLREMMDIKLFVDTEDDIRLSRRLKRDIIERGRDVTGVLEQYERFVKPAFDDYISPTKQHADIIIPRGLDNDVAIDLIAFHVKSKLMERGWRPNLNSTEFITGLPENVHVLNSNSQIQSMATILRDKSTPRNDFIFHSDRLARLLAEDALNFLPMAETTVTTPTGDNYHGLSFPEKIVAISIMRAGDALIPPVQSILKDIPIGAILISEINQAPQLFFYRLPSSFKDHYVLLLDPMITTGHTPLMAVRLLLDHGVEESKILFISVIASSQGLQRVMQIHPGMHIVVGMIDDEITGDGIILPGLGIYGDRYFGTEDEPEHQI